MSDKRFVVSHNEKYDTYEVVDTRHGKVAGIAIEKEYADAAATYLNIDHEPLSDDERDAMWTYRRGEFVKVGDE